MKKLVFGLIATVMFSFVAKAQDSFTDENQVKDDARVKFCITVGCCGVGLFSVDVWHQTSCYIF